MSSPGDNGQATQLYTLLSTQHQAASALLVLMKGIAEAVTNTIKMGGETRELEALLDEKSQVLGRLDQYNSELSEWLRSAGYRDNAVSEALQDFPDDSALRVLWKSLQLTIRECRDQNYVNNTLVNGQVKRIRQMLRILSGISLEDSPEYAEDGKPEEGIESRRWAKA